MWPVAVQGQDRKRAWAAPQVFGKAYQCGRLEKPGDSIAAGSIIMKKGWVPGCACLAGCGVFRAQVKGRVKTQSLFNKKGFNKRKDKF